MPELAPNTCTIDRPELQYDLYNEIMERYELADSIRDADGNIVSADYYLVGDIDNIKYYTPNDETWGGIVAIDHANKLAHDTTFYEMDDMEYPGSDYAMVVVDGVMGCRFDLIPYDAAMMDPEANR
jgi:hypothetical protein